jgi:Transglutaminase-like superfamily
VLGEPRQAELDGQAEALRFYSAHSAPSDPGVHAGLLREIPPDIPAICSAAGGLVIHFRLDDLAGAGVTTDRMSEVDTRYAEAIFSRLLEMDERALGERRAPADRMVGCCRDFTLIFLSIARTLAVPARGRVGFASYLFPEVSNDHEIAEVWDRDQARWRLVDPQISPGHLDPNDGVEIDPTDVPRDRFLVAGAAWDRCQREELNPEAFVVHPDIEVEYLRGWRYLAHNLVLDLATLNKVEILLWDVWGLAGEALGRPLEGEDAALLDRVAGLSRAPDFAEVRSLYEGHPGLKVPNEIVSFSPTSVIPKTVTVRR